MFHVMKVAAGVQFGEEMIPKKRHSSTVRARTVFLYKNVKSS